MDEEDTPLQQVTTETSSGTNVYEIFFIINNFVVSQNDDTTDKYVDFVLVWEDKPSDPLWSVHK